MTETQYSARERPFGRERGPRIALIGLAIFVLVAIVKPWPAATGGQRPGATGGIAAASPSTNPNATSPIPTSTPGPNAMACLAGDVEQIVTLERPAGGKVQSWIAAVDEAAPDPLALRVAPISIFSTHVAGIGVCAPDRGSSASPLVGAAADRVQAATVLDVQVIVDASAASRAVDLGPPVALDGQSTDTGAARLYGAPSTPAPGRTPAPSRSSPGPGPSTAIDRPSWVAGSYAIGFAFPSDRPGTIRWVRVLLTPGAAGSG
jgi:hypothetical protein